MRGDYINSEHPTLQDPSRVPEEFDDPWDHAALAFSYFEETYTLWLDLVDDFAESNQALEDRYGTSSQQVSITDCAKLYAAKRNAKIQSELDEQLKRLNDAKGRLKKLAESAVSTRTTVFFLRGY